MEDQLPARETLPALIRRSLAEPRDAVLVERVDGTWTPTSADDLLAPRRNLACAIRDAGLAPGDRVALIAADCVNWIVADFATLFAGCVVVPIFPTQAPDQVAYILAELRSEADLRRYAARRGAPARAARCSCRRIVIFEGTGDDALCGVRSARRASPAREHPRLAAAFETRDRSRTIWRC